MSKYGSDFLELKRSPSLGLADDTLTLYTNIVEEFIPVCGRTLSSSQCLSLLEQHTGITRYHTAFRPDTLTFVRKHCKSIARAFKIVSSRSGDVTKKLEQVASIVESLGTITATSSRLHVSPFNGLTPVLSCLDPQCWIPIMNDPTGRLLHVSAGRCGCLFVGRHRALCKAFKAERR